MASHMSLDVSTNSSFTIEFPYAIIDRNERTILEVGKWDLQDD